MRKIHWTGRMLNKMHKVIRIYIVLTFVMILARTIDYSAGFSFKGYWADALLVFVWFIATLVLVIRFRKLRWVSICTWIFSLGALLCMPMVGLFLLMGKIGLPGYRFDFYRELSGGYNFEVVKEMDNSCVKLYKTCGPFEWRLATFYVEEYEYEDVRALQNAISVVVRDVDGNVEATFLSPDSGVTYRTEE